MSKIVCTSLIAGYKILNFYNMLKNIGSPLIKGFSPLAPLVPTPMMSHLLSITGEQYREIHYNYRNNNIIPEQNNNINTTESCDNHMTK